MAAALDAGAVVLVAPAGWGKTIALEEALEQRGGPVAWVQCSDADRDAGRFLERVVDAVRPAVPGAADVLGERLAGATEPVAITLAADELRRELERLLVETLTIVVDDAEHLEAEAVAVVGDLLASDAPALRVAVASRRPLPLRLARLRAAGRLAELGPGDLAFTVEGCAQVLAQRTGRAASEREVEAVWTATEGWPLGVALGGASGPGAPARDGSSAALDDYLAEELLAPLEPSLRDAVVDSSLVGELDADLVDALGLMPGFVDAVGSSGIPLRTSQTSDDRIAYHPLVREFLLRRFERERSPARRRELHERAARALDTGDRGTEAVDHWLAGGSPEEAAEAVARHGAALVRTAPTTVADWLARMPATVPPSPELRMLEGQLALGEGRIEDAIGPLRDAMAAHEARGEKDAAWFARLQLADALAIREDFEAAIPLAEGFERAQTPLAPMVAIAAAAARAGACRYREASELFARAVAHPAGAPFAPLVEGFHGFWVDLQCGRLDAALAGTRSAVAALERADPFNRLPYLLGMQALVEEERGEERAALATIERAARLAERTVLSGYIGNVAARFAASVHARSGRLTEAEAAVARTAGPALGWYRGDAEITATAIALHRGEPEAACDAAQRAIDAGGLSPWRARWRHTALLIPLLVEAGRAAWARELAEDAIAARPPLASATRLLALRGWLRHLEGDDTAALTDLAAAWEEAGDETEHLVRRERVHVEPLLWLATERGALAADAVVRSVEGAVPGGGALLPFTRHPNADMRRAAAVAAAGSGHPDASARLAQLADDPDASVAAAARASRDRLGRAHPPLWFTMLGGFSVRRGAHVVADEDWKRRAGQRLVRLLLVHRETVPEDVIFEALWPRTRPEAARRSLQVAVSSARAVLDTSGSSNSVIEVVDRNYRLVLTDRDAVDADEFERSAAAALGMDGPEQVALLAAVADRWSGDPLPEDRYEDWAAAWRERLLDAYRRVLAALAEACSAAGDANRAIDAGRRQAALDPLDEAAHRGLMLAYARSGRRGHALRQYLACRRALVDELGIEPAEETRALQQRILAGESM